MQRPSGRAADELRNVTIEPHYTRNAAGSVLIGCGDTRVLCTASVEDRVPPFLRGRNSGWVTAEYGMLPGSTNTRSERTVTLDCDVLQADGGTRTASITGAYVALELAVRKLQGDGALRKNPLHGIVAAVSVGIYRGTPVLDLDYPEDSEAETDMNVVMNEAGGFIEVQGTAEGHAFRRDELDRLLELAASGIDTLIGAQRQVLP